MMCRRILFFLLLFQVIVLSAQNWKPIGAGINNVVRALFTDTIDNILYAGGNFTFAGGISANGIAKWNGIKWDSMAAGSTSNVLGITRYNGNIFATGRFFGGNDVYIAKWDGIKWDSLAKATTVSWIRPFNNELYACGTFSSIGGINAKFIAKYDGNNWSAIDTTNWLWTGIYDMIYYQSDLYIGGLFKNYDGSIVQIARWDGTKWNPVGNGIQGNFSFVSNLEIFNNELYVAGMFSKSDGNPGNCIAKWDGSNWYDVGGGLTGSGVPQVYDMAVFNGELYAVGNFDYAGNVPAKFIAKWDDTKWCALGSVFDNVPGSVSIYNDTLYIGGAFKTIDGDSILRIAKWTGGTFVDTCGNASGVSENNISFQINIYPNPAYNEFTIQVGNGQLAVGNKYTASIKNILGQTVAEKTFIGKTTFDVSHWASGMYFVKIISGENIYTEKIIIQ